METLKDNQSIIDTYNQIVRGIECDSEKEAYDTFNQELLEIHKWVKGYKYWRKIPTLQAYSGKYLVVARIICSMEKLDNLTVVTEEWPYGKEDII